MVSSRPDREHHGQLPAFGLSDGSWSGGRWRRCLSCVERRNRFEQHAPVAYRDHADILQIIGCQLGQHCPIDFVIAKVGLVSREAQAAQPRRYVHRRPLYPVNSSGPLVGFAGRSKQIRALC